MVGTRCRRRQRSNVTQKSQKAQKLLSLKARAVVNKSFRKKRPFCDFCDFCVTKRKNQRKNN